MTPGEVKELTVPEFLAFSKLQDQIQREREKEARRAYSRRR